MTSGMKKLQLPDYKKVVFRSWRTGFKDKVTNKNESFLNILHFNAALFVDFERENLF